MPTFSAHDGTELAFHLQGDGEPVICLPGGPMQDSVYLGDLGGLSMHRRLVMLDARGTGESAMPADVASYRCDRLVDDLEALREHLGLARFELLAHSAGANLATLYVARYPHRVGKLVLVTPSSLAVGISATGQDRIAVARLREDEPWFAESFAALEAIVADHATEESWKAIDPFYYGRWDTTAQVFQEGHDRHRNNEAAAVFGSDGAFDPHATRAALATVVTPVLLLAGEFDLNSTPGAVAEFAELFPNAAVVTQSGAGHFPWIDDAEGFVAAIAAFLR